MGLDTQLSRQFQPKRVAGAGSITNFMVGWKFKDKVAHTIPKLPIERPGLALGAIGNKMKEWQNGFILSEVLKSVDLCLDHL